MVHWSGTSTDYDDFQLPLRTFIFNMISLDKGEFRNLNGIGMFPLNLKGVSIYFDLLLSCHRNSSAFGWGGHNYRQNGIYQCASFNCMRNMWHENTFC